MSNHKPEMKTCSKTQCIETGAPANPPAIESQTFAYPEDRKMGTFGAVFFLVNMMIGTGIFSTPSLVFDSTRSVGASLMLWLVGGILALCGLSIYLEFGLAIPRSGAEKNYLERAYPRPRYLASCMLAIQTVLLGISSANCLSFGRYALSAAGRQSDGWQSRGIAVSSVTFAVIMHAVIPKWGLRVINLLGVLKVVSLLLIIFSGFAALAGHRHVPDPHNFDNSFQTSPDQDSTDAGSRVYPYCNAMLSIIYSYQGWTGANGIIGELKNPRRTLLVAVPLSVVSVTILYLLANIAYFAAVPKQDIAKSEVLLAATFFRNVFGNVAGTHVLPVFVMLSNLGNIIAAALYYSRIIQELAKEGLLPFSFFWASNKPFNTPAASLSLHWTATVLVLVAVPMGPAYTLVVNLYTYAYGWLQVSVIIGLLWLQFRKSEKWTSPWHTPLLVSIIYLLSNLFTIIVPLVPPKGKWNSNGYPYYVYPFVGIGMLFLGVIYWAFWFKILAYFGFQNLVTERTYTDTGAEVVRYRKVAAKRQ
ncbi:hypothetical protein CDD82_2579 [Ophiocordyceps australis]|uniref:Amino acid permease/ SLC12A domain-containing protein n=1 Tax=Ophiocordyceps australis TaxID=1399860 RepID=A0A2C5ZH69_9HYPO|nr:hypothetical protein CDD82_2579 [Ophiocordyceps australis]